MKYTELFTPHHIAVLVDWFEDKPDLCVELYHPHGGGSASYFTVRSLAELKSLIQGIAWGEAQITIWKNHGQSEFESEEAQPLPDEMKMKHKYVDEVMHFSVTKNRNRAETYVNNPEKYANAVHEWNA